MDHHFDNDGSFHTYTIGMFMLEGAIHHLAQQGKADMPVQALADNISARGVLLKAHTEQLAEFRAKYPPRITSTRCR